MPDLIGVGDNTVDKYLHLRQMFPGGNAVNVAVLAKRFGLQTSYLGRLGNDQYGALILDALKAEGVDISHVQQVEGPNAHAEESVVDGVRVFGPADHGVSAQLELREADFDFIRKHRLAHTSIYSHLETQVQRLSQAVELLSFDFSMDWQKETLTQTAPHVDIAILSYPEQSKEAAADLARWTVSLGPQLALVTQGDQGAVLYSKHKLYHQDIVVTEVVDTMGAGDAFTARLLVEYLGGTPLSQALEKAAYSAAQTCGYLGAIGYGREY